MQTSKALYKHMLTGKIYTIEMGWDGSVLSCRGSLPCAGFISIDWVREENDKLLLMSELTRR